MRPFRDRRQAGRELAGRLAHLRGRPDLLVLGLPRGGVPVAFEVARALDAELDVYMVRKLGFPGNEEFAFGAIADDGTVVTNPSVLTWSGLGREEVDRIIESERRVLEERERRYRGDRPPPRIDGRDVVLVDDGLATGSTMRAAVEALRARNPASIAVAVPVGVQSSCDDLARHGIDVYCGRTPHPFHAVGLYYHDFSQTTDEEVVELLAAARETPAPA